MFRQLAEGTPHEFLTALPGRDFSEPALPGQQRVVRDSPGLHQRLQQGDPDDGQPQGQHLPLHNEGGHQGKIDISKIFSKQNEHLSKSVVVWNKRF